MTSAKIAVFGAVTGLLLGGLAIGWSGAQGLGPDPEAALAFYAPAESGLALADVPPMELARRHAR